MVGNLAVNDSRKTALQLFAAALLCAIGTTLLSLWFFRFYADIDDGRSPHSLFVVVASVFVIAAGPRLVASFTAKHLAYLSLIGIFVGAFLAVAVPAWAPVGSGVTAIAGTFLEIFVYKSLLSLSNATMRKVFVTATVGGIFAGSALPLDAPTALFAASVTDESYGVNTARFAEGNWSVDRALMVNLFSQSSWTISNIVGCAVGAAVDIPVPIAAFAMTAIFICLLVTQKFTSANIVAMIVAMLGVYLCKALGLTGPAILIGAVAGVVCALAFSALFPRRPVTASAPGTDPVGGDLGRPSSSGDSSPDEGGERR